MTQGRLHMAREAAIEELVQPTVVPLQALRLLGPLQCLEVLLPGLVFQAAAEVGPGQYRGRPTPTVPTILHSY
jgi:hypothetical protein